MATANDMDLTQNGIINNVHIPSSPSRFVITDEFINDNQQSVRELINVRDSYAIWARKLSIVPATSDEYAATSEELGNIHTALLATKEKMNLLLFRLPTSIEALDALIKKVEEQRAHLTPVDSTPKETVPSDTTLNSPSKRTLKNLRLKTDRKRLIDDDGFQTPDKRHTAKKIGSKQEFPLCQSAIPEGPLMAETGVLFFLSILDIPQREPFSQFLFMKDLTLRWILLCRLFRSLVMWRASELPDFPGSISLDEEVSKFLANIMLVLSGDGF
ncbi:hypothetical protein TNIN_89781 [Trichonephila inaurata madagascariensis]|uniref:Uncharacterized protein n=1 Tax=Trichonephila inaurata madagascariensis TaxID=2747483 RepID=A0A8X6XK44_9ARAC|nr:hypothetical protein TNIN_89781 [Trichonephila inaurata madagascariensis]